jgi:Mrp family chromosome partitioning ATPase
MGIALAQAGRSVIVVDANLATPNLHAYFGIKAPACTLLDTYWKDMQALRGLDASDRLAESMHAQNYHVIREIETRKSKFESALAG